MVTLKKLDLILAVIKKDIKTVKGLIKDKTSINAHDADKNTALIIAARNGDAELVKLIIDAGAPLNAKNQYGATALREAAELAHVPVVRLLIEAGADINIQDMWHLTPLQLAIMGDPLGPERSFKDIKKTIELLIQAGACPTQGLICAAEENNEKLVKFFLSLGASLRG